MAALDVTNSSLETVIFNPKEMLSLLDLRLIGYYKIKQGLLQQNLRKYYRFELPDVLCEQFNKFINTLCMSDQEILETLANLEKSCLSD